MRARASGKILILGILAVLVLSAREAESAGKALQGTVDQLLDSNVRPFAIGHRGFGADQSRPIENTVPAVRAGFKAGVSVVEVDVQLTSDGEVAVFHDDFLSDFTCLNSLTLSDLQARLPYVPSLHAILHQARKFNESAELEASGLPRGLVIVELKPAAPLCDPDDTQEQAIVSAVVRVIRRMRMESQVLLTSLSPTLLFLAASEAPEIARDLEISGLQFLSAQQIEALLQLPVTLIEKKLNPANLQWAEVGPVFRLPGYQSIDELQATVFVTGAHVIEADLLFLTGPEGTDCSTSKDFVDAMHGFGLTVLGFTINNKQEWNCLKALGVDGIYTNDIPLGVKLQAPIP